MALTIGSGGIVTQSGTVATAQTDYGSLISITSFTSSGTYYVPNNCTTVLVQIVGGGGGSAGYCESGGAGGFAEGVFSVSPGAAISVTVGGGGAATTSGSDSILSALPAGTVTAKGGGSGDASTGLAGGSSG